jgi:hypothetical protein
MLLFRFPSPSSGSGFSVNWNLKVAPTMRPRRYAWTVEVNINALHDALNAIVERHEVLRTTYGITDDGVPVQIVNAVRAVDLPVLDISEFTGNQQDPKSNASPGTQNTALRSKSSFAASVGADQIELDFACLVAVKHHIAPMVWSRGVFSVSSPLSTTRLARVDPTRFPDCRFNTLTTRCGQREWLQGEVLEKQLAYWKGNWKMFQFSTADGPTSWCVGERYLARKNFQAAQNSHRSVKGADSQQGVTPFMTLLAAFQVLLHRYTPRRYCCWFADRRADASGNEGLIVFVNTLVLRTNWLTILSLTNYCLA